MIKNKIFSVLLLALMPSLASATVTYSTWLPADGATGNYILTINSAGGLFNYNLTVNPWNAEALGLFIDLGNVTVGAPGSVTLTNVSPTGQVSLVATDTTSDSCGSGCNLNGGDVSLSNEWDLVFKLGTTGFDNIQTFSWTTSNFGLTESAFGAVGIRSQVLCSGTDLLPGNERTCTASDKSYASTRDGPGDESRIPEPATLALLGLGLFGMAAARRRTF